jgi:hypothetical protein
MLRSFGPYFAAIFFQPRWPALAGLVAMLGVGALAYRAGVAHERGEKTRATLSAAPTSNAVVSFPVSREALSPQNPPRELALKKSEDRWRRCIEQPRTPAVDDEKADCLSQLATLDPGRAMALALGESDFKLREKLRDAVLRGWATKFPNEPAAWALQLAPADQSTALAAVFSGAASRPQEAEKLARSLGGNFPDRAGEFGQIAITALTAAGAYESAVNFAAADPSPNRAAWLNAAFFHWAAHQPEAALRGLSAIAAADARGAAFQGLVTGWADANPAAFADYVMRLAPGEDRTQAFARTLPEWVSREPMEASEWMIRHFTPSTDMDSGVAAVALLPNLIASKPEVAVGWAENISEPSLRAETLRKIAREWAQRDADAVKHFLAITPNLGDDERNAFQDGLAGI